MFNESFKKTLKHIITILLLSFCFSMCISSFSYAMEVSGSCGTFMEWSLDGDVLTISGSGDMADYSDSRFAPWYPYAEEIRIVNLPKEMLSIGDFAFYGCNNLTNIKIPESVTEIGDYAFAQCSELLQIHWSNGVEKIGEGTFQGCESLTSISFPETLKSIGDKAFYRCYGLETVNIPATVESLGSSVFTYCTSLVRATVNASITEVPGWMFYGCTSLTDVSLASNIVSTDDYAFVGCDNLNGIYTQTGNPDTAYQIEQSIVSGEGNTPETFVGSFDMPESSTVTVDNGNEFIQTKVIEKGNLMISVKEIIDSSENKTISNIVISATIETADDWTQLAAVTADMLNQKTADSVTIEINLKDSVVEKEYLALFAGYDVTLKLALDNGVVWKLYMSEMTEESFSGKYDFQVNISQKSPDELEIFGEKVYQLKFADRIDFNASLGFKEGNTYDLASLYQKEEGSYQIINSVVVDQYGWAWFSVGKIDKKTDYCIGLNVEGVKRNDAVVPDTMLQYYDIDEQDEESYLMDEDGVKYQITGRTSKWGISGKQFAIYVGVAILATVLVVGIIMTTINIIKKSREKYERMAEEDALREKEEEEIFRLEILKELLNKKNKES